MRTSVFTSSLTPEPGAKGSSHFVPQAIHRRHLVCPTSKEFLCPPRGQNSWPMASLGNSFLLLNEHKAGVESKCFGRRWRMHKQLCSLHLHVLTGTPSTELTCLLCEAHLTQSMHGVKQIFFFFFTDCRLQHCLQMKDVCNANKAHEHMLGSLRAKTWTQNVSKQHRVHTTFPSSYTKATGSHKKTPEGLKRTRGPSTQM